MVFARLLPLGGGPAARPASRSGQRERSGYAGAPQGRVYADKKGLTYKDAGVDTDAGNELVERIKKINPNIGGFSGLFPFGDSYLVSGTDGVGTKLKLAFDMNKHDTIGEDLVAMSVNDVVVTGAQPLFFLDYFATSDLDVDQAEAVIKGIAKGCDLAGCVLLGGETAEMPGFYQPGEYDLSGFAVGAVKKDRLIDGSRVVEGDVILGLPSSGVHSNGFSLVRKVLERSKTDVRQPTPWGAGSFGEVLLAPTVIYVKDLLKLDKEVGVKAASHITGEGHPGNIPRVLPKGLTARLHKDRWERQPIFQWLQEAGGISEEEMFHTFNMGIGMVVVVAKEDADRAVKCLPQARVIGEVVKGDAVQIV